jgi:hypothetical protein
MQAIKLGVSFLLVCLFVPIIVRSRFQLEDAYSFCEEFRPTPEFGQGAVPQGLCFLPNGHLLFSAHYSDRYSRVFLIDPANDWETIGTFKMPSDATHTSGLSQRQTGEVVTVDYNSGKIYFLDLQASLRTSEAVVKSSAETGLSGASACECFTYHGTEFLAVSDFMGSCQTYIADLEKVRATGVLQGCVTCKFGNMQFCQGMTVKGGVLYESSNTILGFSCLEARRCDDIFNGNMKKSKLVLLPLRGIEELSFHGGLLYTCDEASGRFARIDMRETEIRRALGISGKEF